MSNMDTPRGILLFAHGSRDARWRAPVEAVARRVAELDPKALVACAYLELVEPDLTTAAETLIRQGAGAVRVLPIFLGMGRHAREDLPRLIDALRIRHPGVEFVLHNAVGETPEVIELLARKALQ
jgi:sirohydrochlorin cobaltochelatase